MNDRQIIDEFVVESCDHLADIESQLLAIEAGGQAVDPELVNTVFRAIHSIKGAAGFFQFSRIEELAHALETVLSLVRNRQLAPDSSITDVLLRAADTLRAMIEDVDHSNEVDVSHHLTALQAVAADRQPGTSEPPAAAVDGQHPSTATTDMEQTFDLVQTFVSQAACDAGVACGAGHPRLHKQAATPASQAAPAAPQDSAAALGQPSAGPAAETNIRVSVRVLDHSDEPGGGIGSGRNQLLQTVAANDRGNLDSISARLNQVTSEIQEAVMQTRLQVVETVFSKFPRLVRDLSNTLGKQCELVVEGEDVELDKSIIEAIGDPLTHLIRNAVDHGLESPEARAKAGKPPKGRILLKAFHQAGKVNLAVSDDGAGIDAARIKEEAVSRGVITAEQAREMSDREALRLIFRPASPPPRSSPASAAEGVGMDVVKTNVERLGGSVDVDSQVGTGTTINITLPLTLAIIPSLIVRCEGRRFAIPQASISELVRVRAGEAAEKLQRIKNAEVLRLRGNLLPLVRLSAALGPDSSDDAGRLPASRGRRQREHHRRGKQPPALRPGGGRLARLRGNRRQAVGQAHQELPLLRRGHDSGRRPGGPDPGRGRACRASQPHGARGEGPDGERRDLRPRRPRTRRRCSCSPTTRPSNSPCRWGSFPGWNASAATRSTSVGGQEVLQYRGASLPLLSLEKHIKALPARSNRGFTSWSSASANERSA